MNMPDFLIKESIAFPAILILIMSQGKKNG